MARDNYLVSQMVAYVLRASGSDGTAYLRQRYFGGECVGLFYPNFASNPCQRSHLGFHGDGDRVNFDREMGSGDVYRIS